MDLINLYVKEVGQRLPAASREDIEKEIRTLIDDTLEDESQTSGRPVDQQMVVDVLKRMGSPEKMAASYLPERYLIGPRLFPHYITTLKIVLAIVAVLAVTGLAVSTAISSGGDMNFAELLGQVISGLFGSVFQAAAIVTLVFAMIEYFQPDIKLSEDTWDPQAMKPQTDIERVSLVGGALTVLFTVFFAIVLNFYPQWVGMWFVENGNWQHTPVLSETFFRYLPWINLLWAAEIIKEIILMARGRWTTSIRWADVLINVATAVLAAVILAGPSVLTTDTQGFERLFGALDSAARDGLIKWLDISARITLGIIMGVSLMEAAKGLYRLVEQRRRLATA